MLITAGPTREFFDSVRFISNPSSGKMGYAIAAEAAQRAHSVVLVSGPVELADPPGVEVVRVVSAEEMFEAAVSRFEECQAAVMTAAVCDYRPAQRIEQKLEKQARSSTVELTPTEDICAHLGKIKGDRVLVGFAMEDHDHHAHAEAKLTRKRCDAIVLNGIGNVASDMAEIELLRGGGWSGPYAGTKTEVAARIVEMVEELVRSRS
jgi:phosphopantothenoylcysteine decarboxylase/phosphopantothenate--cysteine ligase